MAKSTMTDVIITENETKELASSLASFSTLRLADDPEYVTSRLHGRIHISMANCQTVTSNKLCQKDGMLRF